MLDAILDVADRYGREGSTDTKFWVGTDGEHRELTYDLVDLAGSDDDIIGTVGFLAPLRPPFQILKMLDSEESSRIYPNFPNVPPGGLGEFRDAATSQLYKQLSNKVKTVDGGIVVPVGTYRIDLYGIGKVTIRLKRELRTYLGDELKVSMKHNHENGLKYKKPNLPKESDSHLDDGF